MQCRQCDYPLWNLTEPRCPECGTAFDLRDYIFEPGTVAFACPHCGHHHTGERLVNRRDLPNEMTCEACGEIFATITMPVVPLTEDPNKARGFLRDVIPWERRHDSGMRKTFRDTCLLAMFSPARLGLRAVKRSLEDEFLFLLVIGVVSGFISSFLLLLLPGMGSDWLSTFACCIILTLWFTPIWAGYILIFRGVVCHVFLVLLETASPRGRFEITASMLAYTQAPLLFLPIVIAIGLMVPTVGLLGYLVLWGWTMVCGIIAVSAGQQVGYTRAAISVLAPTGLVVFLFILAASTWW